MNRPWLGVDGQLSGMKELKGIETGNSAVELSAAYSTIYI